MPRLDRVAGGSLAPRHRHFPAQNLFALLAGCLFNLSHLLRLVRARVAHSLALCGDFLFCLLDKRFLSFGSGPPSRENVILLSNSGARRVLVGDGLFVPLLSTYAAKTEGI